MPGEPPKKVVSDDPFGAAWNQNVDSIRSHRPAEGVGVLPSHTPHGVMIESPVPFVPIPVTVSKPLLVRVKSVQGDYLTCRTFSAGVEGTADLKVAKTPLLRNSIGNRTIYGVVFTYAYNSPVWRIASAPGVLEEQIVIPSFEVNDVLYVIKADTGVTVGDEVLTLLDTNVDRRGWARKPNT